MKVTKCEEEEEEEEKYLPVKPIINYLFIPLRTSPDAVPKPLVALIGTEGAPTHRLNSQLHASVATNVVALDGAFTLEVMALEGPTAGGASSVQSAVFVAVTHTGLKASGALLNGLQFFGSGERGCGRDTEVADGKNEVGRELHF
jgi:hypothetical protein